MTVRFQELLKVVSRFPHATTSAVQLKSWRAGQNRLHEYPSSSSKMREVRRKSTQNCRRTFSTVEPSVAQEEVRNCTCENSTVFCTRCPCRRGTELSLQFTGTPTTIPCTCEVSTVFCAVLHCAYPSLHTTGMSGTNLRHTCRNMNKKDCWNLNCMITRA